MKVRIGLSLKILAAAAVLSTNGAFALSQITATESVFAGEYTLPVTLDKSVLQSYCNALVELDLASERAGHRNIHGREFSETRRLAREVLVSLRQQSVEIPTYPEPSIVDLGTLTTASGESSRACGITYIFDSVPRTYIDVNMSLDGYQVSGYEVKASQSVDSQVLPAPAPVPGVSESRGGGEG